MSESYLKAMTARRADEQRAAERAAERERLLQQTRRARQARQEEHENQCAAEIAAEEEKQKKARAEWAAERERVAERVRQAQKAQTEQQEQQEAQEMISTAANEMRATCKALAELGCWPVTTANELSGFGFGMLAAPFLPPQKVRLPELFVCVPETHKTCVHCGDENAIVDWTYGNRERLRSFLLSRSHQQCGTPRQFEHTFMIHEALEGNTFILESFELCDSIMHAIEAMVECETVVILLVKERHIAVLAQRPPEPPHGPPEIWRLPFKQFLKSQSLHERVTNTKPERKRYQPPSDAISGLYMPNKK